MRPRGPGNEDGMSHERHSPLNLFKMADVQGRTWRVHLDDESLRFFV